MYNELQAKVKKAHAELRAAQEQALATLEQLREQYRGSLMAMKQAGVVAGSELYGAMQRETNAIFEEMVGVAQTVYDSQPDAKTFSRTLELTRIDIVWSEVQNS